MVDIEMFLENPDLMNRGAWLNRVDVVQLILAIY